MVKVVVADDHQIVRQGLCALLKNEPAIEVVGESADGREAVAVAIRNGADLVLMDIAMPVLNGIEACRQLRETSPGCKVIALSMHTDQRYVRDALRAGARGYLIKDCASEELIRAIQTVVSGRVYLSPAVAKVVVDEYLSAASGLDSTRTSLLTDREREVLQLLAEGESTRTIAGKLHVSVKTVESHRKQIMDKLNLYSVAELTKYAVREGITSIA